MPSESHGNATDMSVSQLARELRGIMLAGQEATMLLKYEGASDRIVIMHHDDAYKIYVFGSGETMSEYCAAVLAALLEDNHKQEIERLIADL